MRVPFTLATASAAVLFAASWGSASALPAPYHGLRISGRQHRATPRRRDADPVSLVASRLQALGCDNGDINLQGVGEGEVTNVPPPWFDPLTASNTQLRCFGFPLRPSDPADLAAWTQEMSGTKNFIVPSVTASPDGTSVEAASRGVGARALKRPRTGRASALGRLARRRRTGIVPGTRRADFDGQNTYANWAGFESPRSKQGDHDWFQIQTANPSVQPEYYDDGHYIFSWVGFGGDASYGSGALTQAGIELVDNGKYGGQGTINPFTEWTSFACHTCVANQDSDFPVSELDDVKTVLTFDGETNGIADSPAGESKHDESNVSDAYFDDYTTHNITDVFLASGKHFSDATLDWKFEDGDYGSQCNNQTCVYYSVGFNANTALRLNGTTDDLLNLQNDRRYIALNQDPNQLLVCPNPAHNDNTWYTLDGYDRSYCS